MKPKKARDDLNYGGKLDPAWGCVLWWKKSLEILNISGKYPEKACQGGKHALKCILQREAMGGDVYCRNIFLQTHVTARNYIIPKKDVRE